MLLSIMSKSSSSSQQFSVLKCFSWFRFLMSQMTSSASQSSWSSSQNFSHSFYFLYWFNLSKWTPCADSHCFFSTVPTISLQTLMSLISFLGGCFKCSFPFMKSKTLALSCISLSMSNAWSKSTRYYSIILIYCNFSTDSILSSSAVFARPSS